MEGLTACVYDKALGKTFFDLPLEIRRQIYNLIVPKCRLVPFPYTDPEWRMKVLDDEYRGIPEFVYTCRTLYEDTIPLVYTKATLEVAPAQQSMNYFDLGIGVATSAKVIPYSYSRISSILRFYKPAHLKLIRHAHIFSNQADVVDGHSYEALLQWLVENTGVENIHLSARPMTRIRGRATFDINSWQNTFCRPEISRNLRIVRIWTKNKRTPWEFEKMMRLRCNANVGTLNPCQLYFWSLPENRSEKYGMLQLDPRWLTRLNDERAKIEAMEMAAPMIDSLVNRILVEKELRDYRDLTRHCVDDAWVYQMILVERP